MEIPGVKGKGEKLEELKANMTEAITSALRSMKKESEEWGGKEMVTETFGLILSLIDNK